MLSLVIQNQWRNFMYNYINKTSIRLFTILLISMTLILDCSDSTKADPDPPVLPPQSSIKLELSGLTNDSGSNLQLPKISGYNSSMVGSNWLYAAGQVGFWTTVTGVTLSIPITAFAATIDQDPEYLGDLRWKWTKNFQVLLGQYTSELYGEINGSVVDWEMYISQTGGYSDYLWFTGESNLDGSGGTWTFNKSVEEPVDYLHVEWNILPRFGDLKYEVVQTGAENEGSYIFYALYPGEDYNAACTLFNSVNTNMINVEWHRINRDGHVKSPAYFEDELWHCWDENRDNIECN